MKTGNFKYLVLVFALVATVACGKKKDDGASVNDGRDARVAGNSNLPTGQGQMVMQSGAYVTSANQAQFDEMVKVLVSVTVKPEAVGSVSAANGVELRGAVTVDRQTGAVLNTSQMVLTINDTYSLGGTQQGQPVPPIVIKLAGASGGASNWQANLVFSDDKGTITIKGTYDTNQFRGQVSFANRSGGYNGKTAGVLGDFVIPTCAFFVCQ